MIKPKGAPSKAKTPSGYSAPKDMLYRGRPKSTVPKSDAKKTKIATTSLGNGKMARTSIRKTTKKGTLMYTTIYRKPNIKA